MSNVKHLETLVFNNYKNKKDADSVSTSNEGSFVEPSHRHIAFDLIVSKTV